MSVFMTKLGMHHNHKMGSIFSNTYNILESGPRWRKYLTKEGKHFATKLTICLTIAIFFIALIIVLDRYIELSLRMYRQHNDYRPELSEACKEGIFLGLMSGTREAYVFGFVASLIFATAVNIPWLTNHKLALMLFCDFLLFILATQSISFYRFHKLLSDDSDEICHKYIDKVTDADWHMRIIVSLVFGLFFYLLLLYGKPYPTNIFFLTAVFYPYFVCFCKLVIEIFVRSYVYDKHVFKFGLIF